MQLDEVVDRFTYHPPDENAILAHQKIRQAGLALALLLMEEVPGSKERSSAMTHLEEVVFWANAAIARHHSQPSSSSEPSPSTGAETIGSL